MQEIERKFLVKPEIQEILKYIEPKHIQQGYIMDNEGQTVRVRTKGDQGYLTIKGKSIGISRAEFEYAIPLDDASILLKDFCPVTLEKKRYNIKIGEKSWDIDVFCGKLDGLILAEIELDHEEEAFERPDWLAEEVSADPAYYNSNLVKRGLKA